MTSTYTFQEATLEIIIMLLVAFFLGYFLRYFMSSTAKKTDPFSESNDLIKQLEIKQAEIDHLNLEKASIKKNVTLDFSTQIEELKIKLANSRLDLENCLKEKAESIILKDSQIASVSANQTQDLKIIEGIGPALAKLLNSAGINSFDQLAQSNEEKLRQILSNAGPRYKVHDPSTWPEQAKLAANNQWDELKVLQDKLNTSKA
jgi:predicted flap endonuclease-1-like 5' DNA nuclease